jgi:micrococcal nuclease
MDIIISVLMGAVLGGGATFYFLSQQTSIISPKSTRTHSDSDDVVLVTEIVSIYDGDTFKVSVAHWPTFFSPMSIRVRGIDTPEMHGQCDREKELAKKAKDFTTEKLHNAKRVELHNLGRDKYFRVLADVIIDGSNLTELLIKKGLGKPYDGGTKSSWCD